MPDTLFAKLNMKSTEIVQPTYEQQLLEKIIVYYHVPKKPEGWVDVPDADSRPPQLHCHINISIKPEPENLLRAFTILLPILRAAEVPFSAYIVAKDKVAQKLDGTRITQEYAGHSTRDQRGAELQLHLAFNENNCFDQPPKAIKELLFKCWRALLTAEPPVKLGYTHSQKIGVQPINIASGFPTPFSLSWDKPWQRQRHGDLHQPANPENDPNPLAGVTFTYADLMQYGITLEQDIKNMQAGKIAYLETHLTESLKLWQERLSAVFNAIPSSLQPRSDDSPLTPEESITMLKRYFLAARLELSANNIKTINTCIDVLVQQAPYNAKCEDTTQFGEFTALVHYWKIFKLAKIQNDPNRKANIFSKVKELFITCEKEFDKEFVRLTQDILANAAFKTALSELDITSAQLQQMVRTNPREMLLLYRAMSFIHDEREGLKYEKDVVSKKIDQGISASEISTQELIAKDFLRSQHLAIFLSAKSRPELPAEATVTKRIAATDYRNNIAHSPITVRLLPEEDKLLTLIQQANRGEISWVEAFKKSKEQQPKKEPAKLITNQYAATKPNLAEPEKHFSDAIDLDTVASKKSSKKRWF